MFESYPEKTRDNLTPAIKDELRQIIPKCEICHRKSSGDVHHITEVHTANGSSDLNRAGNMLLVCEDCHNNRLHGEDPITKTRQREIAGKRSDTVKAMMNDALCDRDMAVQDDGKLFVLLGIGALCAVGLYLLHRRAAKNESQLFLR